MKTLERILDSLKVVSLANGNMLVEIAYKCQSEEDGASPIGVMTRLVISGEIEKLLLDRIGKIRKAK